MMNWIANVAVSIWLTSTAFMLIFYINAKIGFAREGKTLRIPLPIFVMMHFCPIIHTIKCFKVMRRYVELKAQRGM